MPHGHLAQQHPSKIQTMLWSIIFTQPSWGEKIEHPHLRASDLFRITSENIIKIILQESKTKGMQLAYNRIKGSPVKTLITYPLVSNARKFNRQKVSITA